MEQQGMKYRRFLAMIAASTAAMFVLMYFNTYALEHVLFSQTRFWMAFVMGACMAVIMLSFMLSMYADRRKNLLIYGSSVIIFVVALYLVRSQRTVDGVSYMKAMVPHHSIAIMTSERANIRDPRTQQLARAIIEAQRREIAEMRYLIAQIEEHGAREPESERVDEPATLASVAAATEGVAPDLLVPQTITDEDLLNVPAEAGRCVFRFTRTGRPVIVAGASAVLKLNGRLVALPATADGRYEADSVRVTLRALDTDPAPGEPFLAEFVLHRATANHELGYHGYSECDEDAA